MTELLYRALAEPIGLLLSVSDFTRTRNALYSAKYAAQDEALVDLQIRGWSKEEEGNLVIVNQKILVPSRELPERSLEDDIPS